MTYRTTKMEEIILSPLLSVSSTRKKKQAADNSTRLHVILPLLSYCISNMNIDDNHDMYDVSSELHDVGLEDQSQFDHSQSRSSNVTQQGIVDDESSHDQLPSVEEHKASQQIGGTTTTPYYRKIIIVIALGIIMASIMITIGVVIGRDSVQTSSAPTDAIKTSDPSRISQMMTMITNMGWSESNIDWDNVASPQRRAVEWLATDDPLQLKVDPTEEFMYRYALATIYFAFNGNDWVYDLHWLSIDNVCEWRKYFETKDGIAIEIGVSCHDGGHVKEIFLPQTNLVGAIPYEIGLLLDLEDLNLFGNIVQGGLPDSMRHLQKLEVLILHGNAMSGRLPPWITSLTKLKTLNLAENEFTGDLPSGMGAAMTSLETLVLEHNRFSGRLDPLIKSPSLTALYLGNNKFDGAFGTELLQSWNNLKVLDASQNKLSGSLPAFLFATDTLLVVDLHANSFTGPLPTLTEEGCSIEFLALQQNQLSGTIGRQLEPLTRLAHLDLSVNMFTGPMPKFESMKTLKYLYLAFNLKFTEGPIPIEYATLPHLVDLSLQSSVRVGTIPYEFEALENLVLFDLNNNMLSGSIPLQLGEMTSLQHLLLKDNKLNGTIPATFHGLTRLNTLLLDHNLITPSYDSVCDPSLPKIQILAADCTKMSDCSCCTTCCFATDTSCNNGTWYTDVDPIASNGYVRDSYFFSESDIIFPAPTNVKASYYKNFSGYYSNTP